MATKPDVSDLETHLGYWMRMVSNHVSQAFARKLETTGVTVAEWVILREMYAQEELAPSVVAESTGLTRGTISKLIERLVEKEFVTRITADGDRRYQQIELTAAGKRIVPKLAVLADRNDTEFFSSLSKNEQDTLRALLKKLAGTNKLKTIPTN